MLHLRVYLKQMRSNKIILVENSMRARLAHAPPPHTHTHTHTHTPHTHTRTPHAHTHTHTHTGLGDGGVLLTGWADHS